MLFESLSWDISTPDIHILSPKNFIEFRKLHRDRIAEVKFIPPKIGGPDLGHFRVQLLPEEEKPKSSTHRKSATLGDATLDQMMERMLSDFDEMINAVAPKSQLNQTIPSDGRPISYSSVAGNMENAEFIQKGKPESLVLDLGEVDLDGQGALSEAVAVVRRLIGVGHTLHLVGPPHVLLHTLYRIGAWPHPRLFAHDVRDMEAYG